MRRLTPQRIRLNRMKADIVRSYEKGGISLRTIAFWHDTSANTIRSILIEEGVKMRKPGRQKGK